VKLLAALISSTLFAQPQPGTIHGVVRDALTGTPMPNVIVRSGHNIVHTDVQGAYTFSNILPGEIEVDAAGEMVHSFGIRKVRLSPGQEATIDIAVQGLGRIGGFVFDAEGKPVADAVVSSVKRVYSLGAIQYAEDLTSFSDSRGEFGRSAATPPERVPLKTGSWFVPGSGFALEAGAGYILSAGKGRVPVMDGAVPEDPAARVPIPYQTWYIGAGTPETALPLTLTPGERRDGVNIRLASGPGYCINGTVRAGALPEGELRVDMAGNLGILKRLLFTKRLAGDAETTLHLCNLAPGEYVLTSELIAKPRELAREFRTQMVTITDRDVKVAFDGLPPSRLSGEVVWEGDPPQTSVTLKLIPLNHEIHSQETLTVKAAVPGVFSLDRVVADEYELQITGIPAGAYLKDVTCAGRSVLHRPVAAGELRVILAPDGARFTAQAPADTWVVAVPASVSNELEVADSMVSGRADAAGVWSSPVLAPGKYLVMSSPAPVNRSVESVGRVFRVRGKAKQIEIAPRGNATVDLN
jgi:Carboxypeptidase regulatory-like domain